MRIPFSKKKTRYHKKKATKKRQHVFQSLGRAIKYLGVSNKDFRKLCIFKGIYPRAPPAKKLVFGSNKTYYLSKDVKYMAHDPLIRAFRRAKKWSKDLRSAQALKNYGRIKNLTNSRKPYYSLDHCIKERYPTFPDALRDLDDALSMIVLFSNLPHTQRIKPKKVAHCARLMQEFHHYVIASRCLRKVFLSVKGIYYRVRIDNIHITWLEPYPFAPQIPLNIDWVIMTTFLQFYETFMGFVLFKLYNSIGLKYPPIFDKEKERDAQGLNSLTSIPLNPDESSLSSQLDDDDAAPEEEMKQVFGDANFKELERLKAEQQFKNLFSGCVFFLAREVPRDSLEFIIKALGGKVGWEGSGLDESDTSITHQISDRTTAYYKRQAILKLHKEAGGELDEKALEGRPYLYQSRDYIQPQWVYDCINAKILLPVEEYGLDENLPPHLSPFVKDEQVGYTPLRREKLKNMISIAKRQLQLNLPPLKSKKDATEEEKDSSDEERETATLEQRFALEFKAEETQTPIDDKTLLALQIPLVTSKEHKKQEMEKQMLKFRAMMIPNAKKRRIYQRMQKAIYLQKKRVNALKVKRKKIDQAQKQTETDQQQMIKERLKSQASYHSLKGAEYSMKGEGIFNNHNFIEEMKKKNSEKDDNKIVIKHQKQKKKASPNKA